MFCFCNFFFTMYAFLGLCKCLFYKFFRSPPRDQLVRPLTDDLQIHQRQSEHLNSGATSLALKILEVGQSWGQHWLRNQQEQNELISLPPEISRRKIEFKRPANFVRAAFVWVVTTRTVWNIILDSILTIDHLGLILNAFREWRASPEHTPNKLI